MIIYKDNAPAVAAARARDTTIETTPAFCHTRDFWQGEQKAAPAGRLSGIDSERRQVVLRLGLGAGRLLCVLMVLMILPAIAVAVLICCAVAFARARHVADVLRALEHEALIAAVAAATLGNGGELTYADRTRLLLASARISDAIRESGHA